MSDPAIYSSGRPATPVHPDIRQGVIAGPNGAHPMASDCWLLLKEQQQLEDGTSAAISPERLARLEAMLLGSDPGAALDVAPPVTASTPEEDGALARLRRLVRGYLT